MRDSQITMGVRKISMLESPEVMDALGIMLDEAPDTYAEKASFPADQALVAMLNETGRVDMRQLSCRTGLPPEKLAFVLRGAIYQDPAAFSGESVYDGYKGWDISANYLSGNIREKLRIAQRAELKFPGVFRENIAALRKICPGTVDIEDIYISLGASWIPEVEYETFVRDFLHFSDAVIVHQNAELLQWKITVPSEAGSSILNNYTYGVRGGEGKQYLTAVNIIEQTLNARTIKVYDYVFKRTSSGRDYEYEPVFNKAKTVEAQDKQQAIMAAFVSWVKQDAARTRHFEDYYNEAMVGFAYQPYRGDFLTFPGMNPAITLYPHQRNAVARVLLSGQNVLLAHHVGTGKTYEMVVSVHELHRLGLSYKNMVVVPNNVLGAAVDAHRLLYPDDNILTVYPRDFSPATRNSVLCRIRDEEQVAVYMAYSSFDMLRMSKEYHVGKMRTRIAELNAAASSKSSATEKHILESEAARVSKRMEKYMETEDECAWLPFEALGIQTLVVDEAHNYKNIPIKARADNIIGMSRSSRKCSEMLEKSRNVQRLIFATGTPLTNSLADLFTLQTYLQPNLLKYHRIHTFDAWINTFGQRETNIECDVDANSGSLRTMTRFAAFHNLNELMALFSQVCDFHQMGEEAHELPVFRGPVNVCVPKTPAQNAYIKELSKRTDLIRSKRVSRCEDNLLKVTIDGRKAALDIRLVEVDGNEGDGNGSKIHACANQVWDLYRRHPGTAQVVFSDLGTPKAAFNVYDALAERLVSLGIPHGEIAYVHDAVTEVDRAKLFAAMNSGKIRIVIGSTRKLGIGVNVQERLIALHHLSVPWRPADMVQREGRILRKGNTCREVFIFRYITEGSFDAYSWQILENKQRFISSFLSGIYTERHAGDIANAVLSYAEVKALAIGNPLIKERVEVSNRLERLRISCRSRQKQMQELRVIVEAAPAEAERFRQEAERVRASYDRYMQMKTSVPIEERLSFGEELLEALKGNIRRTGERIFDTYQGFTVLLPQNMPEESPFILLRDPYGGNYYCKMEEDRTSLGCSRAIDYLLEHLPQRVDALLLAAEKTATEAHEALEDLNQGNPYLDSVAKVEAQLAAIDLRLAENANEKGPEREGF